MNVTDDLIQRSNGLLQKQPEINDWTGLSFEMFNTGSVEVEVAEFLYAMVRLNKPLRILDTGTHFGVSSLYMAQGCKDNNFGSVETHEINSIYLEQAKKLWMTCGLTPFIEAKMGKTLEFEPELYYDFMLLDTEPDIRFAELIKFMPRLSPGGFVFIHDLHRHMSQSPTEGQAFGHPFGVLPDQIKNWVKDGQLRPMHFPTPRGFMGFYRPREDDFKWI